MSRSRKPRFGVAHRNGYQFCFHHSSEPEVDLFDCLVCREFWLLPQKLQLIHCGVITWFTYSSERMDPTEFCQQTSVILPESEASGWQSWSHSEMDGVLRASGFIPKGHGPVTSSLIGQICHLIKFDWLEYHPWLRDGFNPHRALITNSVCAVCGCSMREISCQNWVWSSIGKRLLA